MIINEPLYKTFGFPEMNTLQEHLKMFSGEDFQKQRFAAILKTSFDTMEQLFRIVKTLPNTGKRGRNIFIKTYSRRPMNKMRRSKVMTELMLTTVLSATQIEIKNSEPLPNLQKGTLYKNNFSIQFSPSETIIPPKP